MATWTVYYQISIDVTADELEAALDLAVAALAALPEEELRSSLVCFDAFDRDEATDATPQEGA